MSDRTAAPRERRRSLQKDVSRHGYASNKNANVLRPRQRKEETTAGLRKPWLAALNPFLWLDELLPTLHPAHSHYIIWSLFMSIVILAVVICVPLQIGFQGLQKAVAMKAIDWVTTAAFVADVVVQFRTGYITSQGEVERNTREIALHYLKGNFALDLISAIPYHFFLSYTSLSHNNAWLMLLKMVRLAKYVRVLRFGSSGRDANLLAMGKLLAAMLLLVHGSVCLWHYFHETLPDWPWAFDSCAQCTSFLPTYLFGFYQSFLLLLGDRPISCNNVERVFVICLLFLGALFYAIVVGSMTLLIANMWSTASRHKQRAAMLDDALRYRGVSREVREQVGTYFEYLARFQHPGSDGVAFLQELPVGLYGTVMASMFGPRLAQVQLFAYCERPFIFRLSQRLRLSLYMTGDIVYDIGAVGHDMYIIWKGKVALVGSDGCMAALMSDGDHFGELGLMVASTPRPHRAVALQASDIMQLSRWDLQDAMKDFPESAALVKERARSRVEDHEAPAGNLWAAAAVDLLAGPFVEGAWIEVAREGVGVRTGKTGLGSPRGPTSLTGDEGDSGSRDSTSGGGSSGSLTPRSGSGSGRSRASAGSSDSDRRSPRLPSFSPAPGGPWGLRPRQRAQDREGGGHAVPPSGSGPVAEATEGFGGSQNGAPAAARGGAFSRWLHGWRLLGTNSQRTGGRSAAAQSGRATVSAAVASGPDGTGGLGAPPLTGECDAAVLFRPSLRGPGRMSHTGRASFNTAPLSAVTSGSAKPGLSPSEPPGAQQRTAAVLPHSPFGQTEDALGLPGATQDASPAGPLSGGRCGGDTLVFASNTVRRTSGFGDLIWAPDRMSGSGAGACGPLDCRVRAGGAQTRMALGCRPRAESRRAAGGAADTWFGGSSDAAPEITAFWDDNRPAWRPNTANACESPRRRAATKAPSRLYGSSTSGSGALLQPPPPPPRTSGGGAGAGAMLGTTTPVVEISRAEGFGGEPAAAGGFESQQRRRSSWEFEPLGDLVLQGGWHKPVGRRRPAGLASGVRQSELQNADVSIAVDDGSVRSGVRMRGEDTSLRSGTLSKDGSVRGIIRILDDGPARGGTTGLEPAAGHGPGRNLRSPNDSRHRSEGPREEMAAAAAAAAARGAALDLDGAAAGEGLAFRALSSLTQSQLRQLKLQLQHQLQRDVPVGAASPAGSPGVLGSEGTEPGRHLVEEATVRMNITAKAPSSVGPSAGGATALAPAASQKLRVAGSDGTLSSFGSRQAQTRAGAPRRSLSRRDLAAASEKRMQPAGSEPRDAPCGSSVSSSVSVRRAVSSDDPDFQPLQNGPPTPPPQQQQQPPLPLASFGVPNTQRGVSGTGFVTARSSATGVTTARSSATGYTTTRSSATGFTPLRASATGFLGGPLPSLTAPRSGTSCSANAHPGPPHPAANLPSGVGFQTMPSGRRHRAPRRTTSFVLRPEGDSDQSGGWSDGSDERSYRVMCVQLQRKLAESQAALAEVLADPLKVPAIAALVRREKEGLSRDLAAATDELLRSLLEQVSAVTVRTEDLTQQVAAADDRIQRLEVTRTDGGGVAADSVLGVQIEHPDTAGMRRSVSGSLGGGGAVGGGSGVLTGDLAVPLHLRLAMGSQGSSRGLRMSRSMNARRSSTYSQVPMPQSILKRSSVAGMTQTLDASIHSGGGGGGGGVGGPFAGSGPPAPGTGNLPSTTISASATTAAARSRRAAGTSRRSLDLDSLADTSVTGRAGVDDGGSVRQGGIIGMPLGGSGAPVGDAGSLHGAPTAAAAFAASTTTAAARGRRAAGSCRRSLDLDSMADTSTSSRAGPEEGGSVRSLRQSSSVTFVASPAGTGGASAGQAAVAGGGPATPEPSVRGGGAVLSGPVHGGSLHATLLSRLSSVMAPQRSASSSLVGDFDLDRDQRTSRLMGQLQEQLRQQQRQQQLRQQQRQQQQQQQQPQ